MKNDSMFCVTAVIAALHVVVLSMVFGLRHTGYMLTATLSATLIWGLVFFLNERKRRVGFIVGAVFGLAVQFVAYQFWKGQLPGFWWPLAQFAAVHSLAAFGIGRASSRYQLAKRS